MERENGAALVKAGIPTLAFEANMADPREIDEAETIRRVNTFLYAKQPKILLSLQPIAC